MGEKKPPAGGHRHGGNANEHAALNRPAGRGATGRQYGHKQLLDALHHIPADLSRDDWWRILAAVKAAGLSEAETRGWSATGSSC